MENKPVFVLIHGAGLDGWCWQPVEQILARHGFKSFAPTLTGSTLQDYIQEIIDLIKSEHLQNIILAGHSFGGMMITAVADRLHKSIRRLVYLDAAVPKDGDDFASHIPNITKENSERRRQAFLAMARGGTWIDPIDPALAGITDEDDILWVKRHSVPHPVQTWLEKIKLDLPDNDMPPRTYVLATNPPTDIMGYPAHGAIAQASPQWTYHEIDCGHAIMIINPQETADILLEAAKAQT